MSDEPEEKRTNRAPTPQDVRIDELDALIAYGRFAGITLKQIAQHARTPSFPDGCTTATITQRVKTRKAFYDRFQRFAATIDSTYHRVAGGAEAEEPDVWQDETFLQQQAKEQAESESMIPNGRA